MPTKLVLAGEGGQGVQVVAKIITKAAKNSNKKISYIPSFGVEQRGGVSLAYIQIDSEPIAYPKFSKANIAVVFCNRAIEPVKQYLKDDTLFIYDNSAIENGFLKDLEISNYLPVPAQKIAQEKFSTKVLNMILLGALTSHLKEIPYQEIEKMVLKEFEEKIAKDPNLKELNLGALKEGIGIAEKFDKNNCPFSGSEKKEIIREFKKDKITWNRFPEYCKGCSLCVIQCPVKALSLSKDLGFLGNPIPIVDINKCIGCKKCMDICPDGAIKVEKL